MLVRSLLNFMVYGLLFIAQDSRFDPTLAARQQLQHHSRRGRMSKRLGAGLRAGLRALFSVTAGSDAAAANAAES
jgi:hypothetical protein